MSRKFTYTDTRNWRVATNTGKTLPYPAEHDKAGKPMNDLNGYRDAMRLAPVGANAVRA